MLLVCATSSSKSKPWPVAETKSYTGPGTKSKFETVIGNTTKAKTEYEGTSFMFTRAESRAKAILPLKSSLSSPFRWRRINAHILYNFTPNPNPILDPVPAIAPNTNLEPGGGTDSGCGPNLGYARLLSFISR
ncbi:hypothetical protein EVAR_85243_1 [Eumeta japonica]|uniref:Uncharacterized protein n=1 Tax=Eumeta variegata TaxID=151549 RepID=A0A4C1W0Q5_EUMVA|nr:hypothetical protein EVAR_85243_1 [Eumeta japonica]